MKNLLFVAALALALFPAASISTRAGQPSPLSMQIDRTGIANGQPATICANILSSAAGCMPIGTMSASGVFTPANALIPGGSGDASQLTTIAAPGTVAQTFAAYRAMHLSLFDFGAKCDGAFNPSNNTWSGTDDTTAIKAALTAGVDVDGPSTGPTGGCLFSSTLQFNDPNHNFRGLGTWGTRFIYSGAGTGASSPNLGGDLLDVSQNTTPATNGAPGYGHSAIENLNIDIDPNLTMTGGAALHQFNQGFIDYRNVSIGAQWGAHLYHGMWFDETDYTRVVGFFISTPHDDVRFSGNGAATGPQYDLFMSHGRLAGNQTSTIGVHIGGGVDNGFFDETMDTSLNYAVVVDNAIASYPNQEMTFGPTFVAEYGASDDYLINDTMCPSTPSKTVCQIAIEGHVTQAGQNGGASGASGIHIHAFKNGTVSVGSPVIQGNSAGGIFVEDTSVKLSIAASTQITQNNYGLAASSSFTPLSFGQVFGNATANFQNISTDWVRSTVVNGGTLAVAVTSMNPTYVIPASGITSLTINLPGGAFSGQFLRIECPNAVSGVSWTGAGMAPAGPASFGGNGLTFMWDASDGVWLRMQ